MYKLIVASISSVLIDIGANSNVTNLNPLQKHIQGDLLQANQQAQALEQVLEHIDNILKYNQPMSQKELNKLLK